MRILCKDIPAHTGEEIVMEGWVHRIRELGGVNFVILRDRSGTSQLVYNTRPEFNLETVVRVRGLVADNPKAPGGVELQVAETSILGAAQSDLPFPVNQDATGTGLDTILDQRAISLRNPRLRSIATIQSAICRHFETYLASQDFTGVKTPKLVGTGAEGGTGLFEVDYFGDKVYLAQSPQLYKQTMISTGLERVYEVGAAYRAEKHDTPRHLNEYISLDVEMAFIESEKELMDLERSILKAIFAGIEHEHGAILEQWGATVPTGAQVDAWPVLGHEAAKQIVSQRLGRRIFEINPEAERLICDWAMEQYGVDGVFINDFPRKKRPFYAYPEGLKTRSFDLIFRGIEITSGGQRIHDYRMLKENLPKFGLSEASLGQFYIDIFRYGCPPHGGFAIGLERLTAKILGLDNVKAASLFPRDRRRFYP